MNTNARNLLDETLKSVMQTGVLPSELDDRLKANFEDIFAYFHRLFPNRNDLCDHLGKLVNVLIDNYQSRPSKLRSLDSQREQNPSWFTENRLVGMMLYVDRFAGDLKGLQNRMPYLEELGVNMLHLMPILQCPKDHNDGGYAVSNYRKINPEIGTMEEFCALADQLHDKDMLIMMDFVLNHTSDEHEWAQKAKAGDAKYQAYYHTFDDRTVPDRYEETLPEVFPDTSPGNFTYSPEMGKWVMTVFNNYQWDLNYSNPEVFIEMCDALLFLSNQGIDILRLDALAFMWKKTGTTSQNLEEAHLLIKALKSCMKVSAPATIFLAEAIVAPDEIVKYFGSVKNDVSDECDLCYNATLMVLLWEAISTKNNKLLWVTLNNIPGKPMGTSWLNYVRCHDDIGLGYEDEHARMAGSDPASHRRFIIDFLTGKIEWSFARGRTFMEDKVKGDARISGSLASLAGLEKALCENDPGQVNLAIKKVLMLHGIVLSYGGIPMLYAGDELATLNDYSFENDPSKSADNRWMHRPKMDWKIAEKRNIKGTHQYQIFQGLKKMIQVRAKSPEFADKANTYLFDCHNQHLLAFSRIHGNRKTLVVCNLNDHPEMIAPQIPDYMQFDPAKTIYDKISGKTLNFKSGGLEMKPYEILWITQ